MGCHGEIYAGVTGLDSCFRRTVLEALLKTDWRAGKGKIRAWRPGKRLVQYSRRLKDGGLELLVRMEVVRSAQILGIV